jgi:hypothetical protein
MSAELWHPMSAREAGTAGLREDVPLARAELPVRWPGLAVSMLGYAPVFAAVSTHATGPP